MTEKNLSKIKKKKLVKLMRKQGETSTYLNMYSTIKEMTKIPPSPPMRMFKLESQDAILLKNKLLIKTVKELANQIVHLQQ